MTCLPGIKSPVLIQQYRVPAKAQEGQASSLLQTGPPPQDFSPSFPYHVAVTLSNTAPQPEPHHPEEEGNAGQ